MNYSGSFFFIMRFELKYCWFQTIPARPWFIILLIPRVRIPIITRFSAGIGCIGIITSSDIQMLLILIIRASYLTSSPRLKPEDSM